MILLEINLITADKLSFLILIGYKKRNSL
ncbi:hypothetical protein BN1200_120031 [Klebsiella variicola]|nr:hypothetical protein KVR801_50055 [Klebsiella variicola]CEP32852.1 hypothetical protein KV8917_80030 [Klebsiella variicola]CTQ00571.1 hypothetical protein BN1200_120031 [Klebsiella variicola]CTQ17720.1 hypothetical protein BN1200_180032 [Klebsiella variicola]